MTSQPKKDISGLLIPAGLFIGIGIGLIIDEVAGATIIGLGVGFLGMFIGQFLLKK